MSGGSILLVEDTPSLARLYKKYLDDEDVDVTMVGTGKEALKALSAEVPSVVLLDLRLPDMDGLDILKEIHSRELPSEVVVITAHGSINVAVEAMRNGAYDFLVKPFNAERLLVTVRNALKHRSLSAIVKKIKDGSRDSYFGFIGSSLAMQAVYSTVDAAAASKATVFITGESGTGKEVAAEAIHRQSPRKNGPFVAINCGAIPKDLMESEIFGHVKGAFTGAHADRDGAASRASGGTLFLDEICEMDLALQTKLLRFIQTGTFQKVGGSKNEKVDVRFVCATNRDPLAEVEAGNFREDLYYRLHVIPVHLPPLRDRNGDVVEIARHFLTAYAGEEGKSFTSFSPEAEQIVGQFNWPGNIRQLQNVIRNIVVLNEGETVTPEMLPPPLNGLSVEATPAAPPGQAAEADVIETHTANADNGEIMPLWRVERDVIERAIEACDGNIPKAAAKLGISPSTIYRKKLNWEAEESSSGG
ncbi:MAG: sigma-54-dependent Fis family transcriptional regulator [Rhodospirillales bacterium]|nr:MAG: sigma-54-dependent Fis family transcriptional regulator [Rhodospirillales bacterium]